MGLFTLLRFITPNASVAVSELGADLTTTAALGQAVENLDTYATRNNGTNTATSAMTLDLSAVAVNTFKTRVAASAAPTADGTLETDSTSHAMVRGRNGSKVTLAELETAQTWTAAQTFSAGMDASGAAAGADKVNDLQVTNGNSGTGITMTDISAPAAPGANKTTIYTVGGVPHYRAGASGADTILGGLSATIGPTFAAGDTTMTNASTWYTGVTLGSALVNGKTYLLSATLNLIPFGGADSIAIRLFDSTNSVEIASTWAYEAGTGGHAKASITIPYSGFAGTPTIVVQANDGTNGGTIIKSTASPGGANKASFISAVG